jgi:hypothetical protein
MRTLTLAETSGLMYPEGICTQTTPVHLFDQPLRIRIHFKNNAIRASPPHRMKHAFILNSG